MTALDPTLLSRWLSRSSAGSQEREQAIRNAAGILTAGTARDLLDLTALAHRVPSREAAARVRAAVSEHDPKFPGRPNDHQTQVAAAWAVATAICGSDLVAAEVAALATASATFGGHTPRDPVLGTLASDRLTELSEEHRARSDLSLSTNVPKALGEFEIVAPDGSHDLNGLVEASRSALRTIAARMERALGQANQRLGAADEELDLLWWTFRGRRDGTAETWDQLGSGAAILAGLDIFALTRFPVPFASTFALLSDALVQVKTTTLGSAVNAAAERVVPRSESLEHLLLPVTTALQLRFTAPADWRKTAQAMGIALNVRPSPPQLAEQVVREELIRSRL